MIDPLLRFLDWDTDFFGYRIFRADVDRLDAAVMEAISKERLEHGAECIYLLVGEGGMQQAAIAEDSGFRLMDVRVTLESSFQGSFRPTPSPSIRPARPEDIPRLEELAALLHRDSRFFADPRLAVKAPELYRAWIAKSIRGGADLALVAEVSGRAAGYFTGHRVSEGTGRIDLVGVSSETQGLGLGRALMQQAMSWFSENGMKRVEVVTQARNLPAQRLYQRSGFTTARVQLWFHKWFV
jgi:ribosomal protein S18 acetylase RimI-like enzyme